MSQFIGPHHSHALPYSIATVTDESDNMNASDLFCLRWALTEGLGNGCFRQYVSAGHSLDCDCFEAETLPLFPACANNWKNSLNVAEKLTALLREKGIALLAYADSAYPPMVRQIADPPPVLFMRGSRAIFEHSFVAVVGTRKPTPAGERITTDLCAELTRAGVSICSGLALGIDGCAHRSALDAGGVTVAVMGTGVDIIYPRRHEKLAASILEREGAIISEMVPGTPPRASHFPPRNRLISGISVGTVVIEATLHSGSLITAYQALEQNREVYAVPGSIRSPCSAGCHRIIQQGAQLITSAGDILSTMGIAPKVPKSVADSCSDPHPLLVMMGYEIWHLDELLVHSKQPLGALYDQLINLECRGHIRALSGGRWQRI